MSYRYETHCHTSESSACGKSSAADLVHAYYHAGYTGMVITDHFFNGNCSVPSHLPWEDRIDAFAQGFYNAEKAALSLDFDVFFGFEYNDHSTEFLIYNFSINELKKHPDLHQMPLPDFLHLVRQVGGFIIHAHPYREADYINKVRLFPDEVDAVEVINKSHKDPSFDKKALEYATKYNLPKVCGSDTHDIHKMNNGGIYVERRMKDIKELITSIRTEQASISPKK